MRRLQYLYRPLIFSGVTVPRQLLRSFAARTADWYTHSQEKVVSSEALESSLKVYRQVIFGPMFSGKTTELIRRLKRYQVAKYKCLIVRYANDDRYSTVGISTHDKQQLPAVSARQLSDLKMVASENCVIGVDEGQFFPDCVSFAEEMANQGKIVIIAALDGTFQRVGFGNILDLVPIAESVVKLKAVCHSCFKDAAFTKRTSQDMQLKLIGGNDLYMAVCRDCYLMGLSETSHQSNALQPLSKNSENVPPAHKEKVLSIGTDKYQQRMAFDENL